MSEELTTKSATELASLIRSREVSPVEVIDAHLRRIESINPSLNAIVTLAEDAIDHARAADSALSKGETTGPLHGVPLTVKDTIDTKGLRTTSGSRLRADDLPQRDATVVTRLKTAGAIILGKTNTSEMAIPYETDNPLFGRTNNPHDLSRTPGGSSGGEAAAIAATLSPAGIGSDLAGSIRVPAHFCGITGLKPTTGSVPMEGHLPLAKGTLSLGACIGPMARRVADLALLFSVIAHKPEAKFLNEAVNELGNKRVAWYADDGVARVAEEVANAVRRAANILSKAGLNIIEERPPSISHGPRLWVELFSGVANEQIRSFYRGREREAGPLISSLLQSPHQATFEEKVNVAESLAKTVLERERLR